MTRDPKNLVATAELAQSAQVIAGDPEVRQLKVGCACASGPVFAAALDAEGRAVAFEIAYPLAPKWMQRLAVLGAKEN